MSIRNNLLASCIATALLGVASQSAQAFDTSAVTVRVRAIQIAPANKSDPIAALGVPKDGIEVEKKWAPDIDFEYAITPHVGVELLLTVPQRHDVIAKQTALGPNVSLGSVQHLPPTLTGKYYFLTDKVRPYVGAGLNFTWFTDNNLSVKAAGINKLDIKSTSFGLALQAGVDVTLVDKWSLSLDVKKVDISTDVSLNGTKLSTVSVDPYIYGIGVGYRF
jgi:outer membrane protein